MRKEEYMEIGEKFWKMDTAIINFCGMPEGYTPANQRVYNKRAVLGTGEI